MKAAAALFAAHERQRTFGARDARRLLIVWVILLVTLGAGIAIDFVPSNPNLTVGTIAANPILAPRNYDFFDQAATDQLKAAAAENVLPQYDYTAARAAQIADSQVSLLRSELGPVDQAFRPTTAPEARRIALGSALPGLSSAARQTLLTLTPQQWSSVENAAVQVLDSTERMELTDPAVADARAGLAADMPSELTPDQSQLAVELIKPLLVANSSFSQTLTAQKRQQAADAVKPVHEMIQQGQVIVDAGHPISQTDMLKIEALSLNTPQVDWSKLAAWILLGAIAVMLLLAWIWRFRPELWHRNRSLVLIGLILVVTTFVVKLAAGRLLLPYLVPTAAAGMLLTVLVDEGMGTMMLVVVAVLAGVVNIDHDALEVAAYVLLGGVAATMTIRKGERLQNFVQSALAVAVTDVAVVAVFGLLGTHDLTGVLQLFAAATGTGVISAIVTVGSFAVLGNMFGILTGFQLLELANPSQPLLRRLLTETPGTYHHALMVGNLAERAAAAIGADPLLTRVAAYYHDVGKLANPFAFIENQAGGENIHDQLEPLVSAQVLKQHVPDGIDLAYKARLPKALIAFIPQHHGTALLSYFYAKARELAAAPYGGLGTAAGLAAADGVDQRRFRHAGPKPQSREAALLMLADGVEASVRSLASRDEGSIRAMVRQIMDERLQDGQLDECDLTIADLERVREAFVGQLLGMYHQRIAYPQNKVVELESRRERGAS